MPKFLEEDLKREYPNNPHAVYGTMNKIGAMRGNKETAKGQAMEAKHEHDTLREHAAAHGHARHADAYAHGAENQRKGLHKGLHHGGLIHHASGYGHSGPAAEAYAQGATNEANGMHDQEPEMASPQAETAEESAEGEE